LKRGKKESIDFEYEREPKTHPNKNLWKEDGDSDTDSEEWGQICELGNKF